MSIPRSKCLSTKLTDDEYTELERAAGAQTLSTWARDALLNAARHAPADSIVVAEVLALRTILVNLQFAQAVGDAITAERLQQLIDRADRDRFTRAATRLAEAGAGDRQ
jgi:parvulin-like peptidyl-prolyl isomerase